MPCTGSRLNNEQVKVHYSDVPTIQIPTFQKMKMKMEMGGRRVATVCDSPTVQKMTMKLKMEMKMRMEMEMDGWRVADGHDGLEASLILAPDEFTCTHG